MYLLCFTDTTVMQAILLNFVLIFRTVLKGIKSISAASIGRILNSVTVYVLCVDVTLSQGYNPLDLFFIAVHTTYLHLKVTLVI